MYAPRFRTNLMAGVLLLAAGMLVAQPQYQPPYQGEPPQGDPNAYPTYPGQMPAQQPGQAAPQQQILAPEQLNDLVAPIALYPDPLIGQVLVAATYPLEIVEANQWLQQNSGLRGPALIDAAKQQPWDPSIQTLVATPEVLGRLAQNIRWTTDLGNAFLAQQADVMNAVQTMRQRAQRHGQLYSNPQQQVSVQDQGGQEAIAIQPADPNELYVPEYNPAYVYGPPVWGYYPPLYYPSGFFWGPPINFGFCFAGWGGWGGFGWGPNWFGRTIVLNGGFFGRFGFGWGWGGGFHHPGFSVWAHDPAHRGGIAYPNRMLAARYQGASLAGRGSAFNNRSFPQSNFGNRPAAAFGGNRQAPAFRGNEGFRNEPAGRSAPAAAPASRFSGNGFQATPRAQNFSAPRQNFSAPQHFSAPAPQHFSPPAQQHFSAPSHGFSGGGGGGAHFSGGGGGGHASGGGHHR